MGTQMLKLTPEQFEKVKPWLLHVVKDVLIYNRPKTVVIGVNEDTGFKMREITITPESIKKFLQDNQNQENDSNS
jgi:hypothetical protein